MNWWDYASIFLVLILGVPHGGLDAAVARRVGCPNTSRAWLLFHATYILLSLLVVCLWWFFPLLSLSAFLLISVVHFGFSDITDYGSHWFPALVHGGLVSIAIPVLQSDSVEPIFSVLVGSSNANILLIVIENIFYLWTVLLLFYLFFALKQRTYRKPLIILMVMLFFAYSLPPLVTFAIYFCLSHSRGHLFRQWQRLPEKERSRAFKEILFYSLASWTIAAGAFFFLDESMFVDILRLTFIGLAALTVPHMLLVDYADRQLLRLENEK